MTNRFSMPDRRVRALLWLRAASFAILTFAAAVIGHRLAGGSVELARAALVVVPALFVLGRMVARHRLHPVLFALALIIVQGVLHFIAESGPGHDAAMASMDMHTHMHMSGQAQMVMAPGTASHSTTIGLGMVVAHVLATLCGCMVLATWERRTWQLLANACRRFATIARHVLRSHRPRRARQTEPSFMVVDHGRRRSACATWRHRTLGRRGPPAWCT